MDLKEAIIHTRQVAEGCGADNRDCAYQHDKLGDWLEELQAYRSIGTIKEFHTLKAAEQKRREGCKWCHSCYSCDEDGLCPNQHEMPIEKCGNYLPKNSFCRHCGRNLRGENHEQM